MRVLVLSAFFPPDAQGGAEISAWNLARWLRDHGHDVGVLTTARRPEDACEGRMEDGLAIWRIAMPRPYPVHDYGAPAPAKRAIWHIQDHLDPRNRVIAARVLDAFRPDFVNVHLLTGLGWNILPELGRRRLPILFALPDLVLACLRSGMFRNGRDCERQCADCRISSLWKRRMLAEVDRIGFYSPSAANLARLERFVPLGDRPRRVLANANRYPPAAPPAADARDVALLYAGRLHPMKGVDVLIAAADRVAATHRFTLDIVGDGPQGDALRARFADRPWLRFHGHVAQQAVSDAMAASDMLCLPSVWSENAPGVAIQALGLGLPILGSDIGGIPELVHPGETGELVPPGDVGAWAEALATILNAPDTLAAMRRNARARARAFDPELLGGALYGFMEAIRDGTAAPSSSTATSG